MAPVATLLIVIGIIGLFWLDRQPPNNRPLNGTFVPFTWLLVAMSRPLTSWTSSPASFSDRADAYLEGSPIDRNFLIVLIAMSLVVLWRRREAALAMLRANAPIIALFAYCFLSIFWAEYPVVSGKRWIRGVSDVLMILVILTDAHPASAFQWIMTRIGFLLVPTSILFIRFYPEWGRTYSRGGLAMWTGVCTDKNALGALCMVIGAVTLWRMMKVWAARDERRLGRLIALTSVFLMVIYLIQLVNSKTAQMCFLFATVVIALKGLFRRPWLVFCFTVGTVVACYMVLIAGFWGDTLEVIGRDETLTGRTQVWEHVLEQVQNPWFGAGYENFWIGQRLAALFAWGGNQSHNGYIEVYVNLGWVGLALLGVVIVTGYRNMIKFLRASPDLGRLKVAFFVVCLTYNFSEAAFKMMMPVWLMFLWATMATPQVQPSTARSRAGSSELAVPRMSPSGRVAVSWVPRHGQGRHVERLVHR
jgi:exopolysaccharide production protein ExoQ